MVLGAFRNNPEMIARVFKEVLNEYKLFDNVVFAIKSQGTNLNAFTKTFDDSTNYFPDYAYSNTSGVVPRADKAIKDYDLDAYFEGYCRRVDAELGI